MIEPDLMALFLYYFICQLRGLNLNSDTATKSTRVNDQGPTRSTSPRRMHYASSGLAPTRAHFNQLIIFLLFLVGLLPVLFGLAGIFNASKKELIESKGVSFMKAATYTAFQVEKIIEEKVAMINRLSTLPTVINTLTYPKDSRTSQMENLRLIVAPETNTNYFVGAINNDGNKVIFESLTPGDATAQFSGSQKLINDLVQTGKISVSDIMKSMDGETYFIEIYAPVKSAGGQIIGILAARYEATNLFETINKVTIGKTGHANLITSNGQIIVCPILPIKSHYISPKLMYTIAKRGSGWIIADDDGHGSEFSIVGFSPVNLDWETVASNSFGNQKWYVFTRQEPSETYESIKDFQWSVIGYAVLVTAIALALGAYAWRQIVKAQREMQSEVVYREKAESVKQLLLSLQGLMGAPYGKFGRWLDEMPLRSDSEKVYQKRIEGMKAHFENVNSVIRHFEYYAQTDSFEPQPTDLTKIVEETLNMLDYLVVSSGIVIKFYKPEEPVPLMGQPVLLNIVFMNILLNAIHAVGNGSIINISVGQNGGWGECVIRDDGAGIPGDVMEKIFDPFYTTKKGHKEFGMGLAVSRGIIEKHGGVITVSSSEKDGTEVSVKLKLDKRVTLEPKTI